MFPFKNMCGHQLDCVDQNLTCILGTLKYQKTLDLSQLFPMWLLINYTITNCHLLNSNKKILKIYENHICPFCDHCTTILCLIPINKNM